METEFNRYFTKSTSNKIIKHIQDFTEKYSKIHDAEFLYDSIYETKCSYILDNFKINKSLVNDIKTKKIKVDTICYLKPEELNPNRYKAILEKKEKEFFKKTNTPTTDIFTCKQCGSKKCRVTEKQTRSGDEPATTFVNCVVCNYSFRF